MLKVLGGEAKGRVIKAKGKIRPTLARVRQSIFDIFQDTITGKRVLDLFAGTGALGIEALSRGAKEVVFVDNQASQIRLIKENLEKINLSSRASIEVVKMDAIAYIHKSALAKRRFDFIFLAPPFNKGLVKPTLTAIVEASIIEKDGFIVIEHHKLEKQPLHYLICDTQIHLTIAKKRLFGATTLTILHNRC